MHFPSIAALVEILMTFVVPWYYMQRERIAPLTLRRHNGRLEIQISDP